MDPQNPHSADRTVFPPPTPGPAGDGLFDGLAGLSADLVYLVDLDQGRLLFANPALRDFLGLGAEDVGRVTLERVAALLHPDDRPILHRHLERLTGADPRDVLEWEARIRRADGTLRRLQARDRTRPVIGAAGRLVMGIARDVTECHQRDAALRNAEALFQTMADTSPVLMWVADRDGRMEFCNRRLLEQTGLSLDAIRGLRWRNLVHPADQPVIEAAWRQALSQHADFTVEHRIGSPDGRPRWMLTRATAVRDDWDRVVRWFGSTVDIDCRRQAELALRTSHERLRLALETARLTVFQQDRGLRYTWIYNPALGFAEEEVRGRTDAELMEYPGDVAAITALKRQVVERGQGLRQVVRVHHQGQDFWYDMNIQPQRSADGEVAGIIAAAKDVTELQTTLRDLERSRERFRTAQELALDAFAILRAVRDAGGRPVDWVVDYANPALARMAGFSLDQVIGHRLLDLLPGLRRRNGLADGMVQVMEGGMPLDQEVVLERDDTAGTRTTGWYRATVVRLSDGLALQFVDLTDRKRHEAERQAALERRALLLKELNHRIKNSLQLVASLLRLQAGNLGEEPGRLVLERACQRVACIAEIHARLYMTEEVGLLDFGAYVRDTAPRLREAMADHNPKVGLVLEAAEGTLDVDRAIPLGLVLNGLLTNALRHAYDRIVGGEVRVGFRVDAGRIHLWVADQGRGLGEHQTPPERLGLRLVRALVGQVDGTLTIRQDKGMRFDITVPLSRTVP